jgi:hypothetical protein
MYKWFGLFLWRTLEAVAELGVIFCEKKSIKIIHASGAIKVHVKGGKHS